MTNSELPAKIPANLGRVFKQAQELLTPPPDLTVAQWAEQKRVLTTKSAATQGKWSNAITPYLIEPMEAFTDPEVQDIVVVASSQVGKTEFELNCLGYIIDCDPAPIMFVMPVKDDCERTSKTRLSPMIQATPALKAKVAPAKSRDANNTIFEKQFPGGFIRFVGSTAAHDLAGTPARYAFADERDRWAVSAGKEGDPWKLLCQRTKTFYNRKRVQVSTPTIKGASPIAEAFEEGTKERYCVECPDCKEWSNIVFGDIRFEHEGREIIGEVMWRCPKCGCAHSESEVRRMPKKWIAEAPDAVKLRGCRSFWINAFVSNFTTWKEICQEFLDAGKDPLKLQVVHNTVFGELWEDREGLPDEDGILSRRETYNAELPDGVLALTCGVDTQDDRLEYEVVGWGRFGENWGIKRGVINGVPNTAEVWERLDDITSHTYHFENGRGLKILATFIDSGGHFTQEVYEYCRMRKGHRIFPIKGLSGDGKQYVRQPTLVDAKPKGKYTGKVKLYTLGVDAGKAAIMDSLSVQTPGAKYCHFPRNIELGYDEKYFNGLLSEHLVIKTTKRGRAFVWDIIPGHQRNEPLDCRNYAQAAFRLADPDLDAVEARLRAPLKKPVQQAKKAAVKGETEQERAKPAATRKNKTKGAAIYDEW